MAIVPWSPLAGGFLAGTYTRAGSGAAGDGRLGKNNPFGDSKFTERNWRTLEVLREVADGLGRPPSQVALAWTARQALVGTILLGTRTEAQLTDNLASLELDLPADAAARLTEVSAIELGFPYGIYTPETLR